ncbi:MAG TPA: menaquinone biosynthesis protein [Chitinophagaceae bacterium]|nr:menaquinone biosynthesis protein [Chitinophagaceae bacterium]
MNKIKVGIVSYLNTRPLIYGLKLEPIASQIDLIEDNPARLAEMLKNNEIDLGLVPVAAIPELTESYLSGEYCIGTEGEAASVCLFSEVPLDQIEKVFLDYQSRTSVELLKWIMHEYWGIQPEIVVAENEDYRKEIKGTTAGLVIGDRAFEQRKLSTFFYDLGAEWKKITGQPFVFAVWISNKKLPADFIKMFNDSNAKGLKHIDEIVASLSFDLYDLKKYYTLHMNYLLDEKKKKAMDYFLRVIGEQVE